MVMERAWSDERWISREALSMEIERMALRFDLGF